MTGECIVVSAQEFAEMFGVSDDLVYSWLDEGLLPELVPAWSRRRLIPRVVVDQLVEECMRGFDVAALADRLRDQLRVAS